MIRKNTETIETLERTSNVNTCNPRCASGILADDKNRGVTAFMPLGTGVYENKKVRFLFLRLKSDR